MSKREWIKRGFALAGAALFLVTSLTLTILVIWQMHQQSRQNAKANQVKQATAGCDSAVPSPAETLPDPEVYKPAGSIKSLEKTNLIEGMGAEAKNGDCLEMKYYGTLASDGTKFDSNYDKPLAFKFRLGAGAVIVGWDQGLVGMRVGGTRRLVIPSALAYGAQAAGSIPANSDLVFVVKLVKID